MSAPNREMCPNCRTVSTFRSIAVSDTTTIAWCENCRVPRLMAPSGDAPPPRAPSRALPRTTAGKWRWFDVAAPPTGRR